MKESYRKGVANHPDLDPCEGVAKQSTHLKRWEEAHVGWVSRSCELRNSQNQSADGVRPSGTAILRRAPDRECAAGSAESKTPRMHGNFTRENRETRLSSAAARRRIGGGRR